MENEIRTFGEHDADAYANWLEHHVRGYVINLRPRRAMLHTARCFHLSPASWYDAPTKIPKSRSIDRETLEQWATSQGLALTLCSTCKV